LADVLEGEVIALLVVASLLDDLFALLGLALFALVPVAFPPRLVMQDQGEAVLQLAVEAPPPCPAAEAEFFRGDHHVNCAP
jgi:hypothetical protein